MRGCHELGPLLSTVAAGQAVVGPQADRDRAAPSAGAHLPQSDVVLRLCVRLVRQRATPQVPDRHRRIDPEGTGY